MDYLKLIEEERERIRLELLSNSDLKGEVPVSFNVNVLNSDVSHRHVAFERIESSVALTFPMDFQFNLYRGSEFDDLRYIPDIVSEESEKLLSKYIRQAGETERDRWKQLRTRRLQCWGKFPPKLDRLTDESANNDEHIPLWLDSIIDELVANHIFDESTRPNNILINQYQPHEGILHHTDGPAYVDKVAIISLDSDCIMTFRHNLSSAEIGNTNKTNKDVFSVLLRRRSLLYFSKHVYSDYMHGIESMKETQTIGGDGNRNEHGEVLCDCVNKGITNVKPGDKIQRGVRTSLTFRRLK